MSTNDEVLQTIVKDDYELIKKCWSTYALVYNPLKIGSIDGTDTIPHDRAIAKAQDAYYRPNKKVKGKPEATIIVFRLSASTSEGTLKKVFSNYGTIKRCRLVEDIVTGRSKCYAFIEYENERSAHTAYKRASGLMIDGKSIGIDMECERLLPGWIPRRLGGGFSGRKESGQLRFGCRYKPFKKPIQLMTDLDQKGIESSSRSIMSERDYQSSSENGRDRKKRRY